MTNKAMLKWIENASYEDMLRKQRYAPLGDPFFDNSNHEICNAWNDAFIIKREETGDNGVGASKRIGWDG